MSPLTKTLLLIVLLGCAAVAALLGLSSAPAISLDPALTVVGISTPIKLHVDASHGARRVSAFLDQNGTRYPVFDASKPPRRLLFWRNTEPPVDLTFLAGSKTTPSLKDGKARIVVEVVSNDFRGATATAERDIDVITKPPTVSADGEQHYINQGGSELVMLFPDGYWTEAGVKVGAYAFRSFALPGGRPGRFSLYAYPIDLPDGAAPRVFAANPAGNEAAAHFAYKLFPKKFRTRELVIEDGFLRKVTDELDPGGSGDLLARFLKINGEMRRLNNQTLAGLRLKTEEHFLWTQPFRQQTNSKVESQFADVRSYIYKGKKVDRQVHLGFDLSVTQHVGVEASNDGKVVYASRLGIYGNCIVLDHGYGLQSIYGHLSQIDVKVGDMVQQGQIIGHSGSTGLAGGDHLHFSMQLDGVQVNPVEWWDAHWIRDHVTNRLQNLISK